MTTDDSESATIDQAAAATASDSGDAKTSTTASADPNADVADLGYEQARDQLAAIVARLEGGSATLEDSMRLWERGEALAAHCQRWLDGAQRRIESMTSSGDTSDS
ncbi:exodeoxyribonuclease VII small subunit [Rudaeicoccus suwonensis]|uniref:Exodeoxyribonuclease 7 small subunit n=1 Tax=Rudaeicoccus suwonensis TaxID=657409 RepID=A0A561E107_9MICO|nr:exodeoxyribonuclease VII small subunit [Rudaeicoccus suwonensis]